LQENVDLLAFWGQMNWKTGVFIEKSMFLNVLRAFWAVFRQF
jgi:hypothetical protein